MFLARPFGEPAHEVVTAADLGPAIWLDLLNPSVEEVARAEKLTGLSLPRREQLDEIESSSRQYRREETLYLSLPLVRRTELGSVLTLPVGIVLGERLVVTVRYSDYMSFDSTGQDVAAWVPAPDTPLPGALEMLVMLLEAIVNRIADVLEGLGRDLDAVSRAVFSVEEVRRSGRTGEKLRQILRTLGRSGDYASSLRDSLLALDRVGHFLGDPSHCTLSSSLQGRTKTLSRDIVSLNDYVSQTVNKVQFLLDATLGFINIEQNDGMKLLTVVSFIGVTPTLIVGVYGMNFHNMPELSWKYGYYYSLALVALSIAIPLLFFWRRGWFGDR